MASGGARQSLLRTELDRLVEGLKKAGARKIILFGSLARQDADEESDIDLIVVMDTPKRFVDRLALVYDELVPRVATDVLVYTPEEFEELRQTRPFIMEAIEEGKVLYEA